MLEIKLTRDYSLGKSGTATCAEYIPPTLSVAIIEKNNVLYPTLTRFLCKFNGF